MSGIDVRIVQVPGTQIWSQSRGTGPPVLLVAGLGDSHEAWRDLVDRLAGRFRVITLDNRGVGLSPVGDRPLSIEVFAHDALAVLAAWALPAAHVVGSSMGGAIAQLMALICPQAVRSLGLIGTWGRPDPHLRRLLEHMVALLSLIRDPREQLEAMALWVYASPAHGDGTVARLIDQALASDLPEQSIQAFTATARAAMAHDAGDRLAQLRVPTLVLVGEQDRICPPFMSRDLTAAIEHSSLQILPGCGHQPFQENADGVAAALRAFWSTF